MLFLSRIATSITLEEIFRAIILHVDAMEAKLYNFKSKLRVEKGKLTIQQTSN